jgi:hypothetical protein
MRIQSQWAQGGCCGIYNRSNYEREKRAALEQWVSRLMATVGGEQAKIVPLRSGVGTA